MWHEKVERKPRTVFSVPGRERVDYFDTEHVYWCRVSNGRNINYSWIVANPRNREAVVVDPAWELNKIENILTTNALRLKAVLVTHHHHDHFNLADSVADRFKTNVWISAAESYRYGIVGPNIVTFRDGERLDLAGLNIIPIVTPGHTAGSTCFQIGMSLFTGDSVFNEGCGMCVGPGADPISMYRSLQRLRTIIDDEVCVYPGHRYASELGKKWKALMRMNVYLNIQTEKQFVDFRMRAENTRNAFMFI